MVDYEVTLHFTAWLDRFGFHPFFESLAFCHLLSLCRVLKLIFSGVDPEIMGRKKECDYYDNRKHIP